MNDQVEVTWQTLRTISHSIMVNAQVSDKYIHFALMYTTDNISPVLPNWFHEPGAPNVVVQITFIV